jgi:hypothetical protein
VLSVGKFLHHPVHGCLGRHLWPGSGISFQKFFDDEFDECPSGNGGLLTRPAMTCWMVSIRSASMLP